MLEKEYDLFMNMLRNPEASFDTFMLGGLTTDNTQLLDKSEYKSSNKILDALKDLYGQFDEVKFDKLYSNALMYYNIMSLNDYDKKMKELITYHRDDIFAPVELRRKGPDFTEMAVSNPYQYTMGVHELGKVGERTKSVDEIAQANKVLLNPTTAGDNLENAQWGDSPNNTFIEHFFDTLVLALYDLDGTHIDPITGDEVEHKKGELKLDDTGNFYYEKLDGRDIYGRRVLNKMNILTTDGSKWNRYDFFDSDDINLKSIGGSILKNLALVGSMCLPYVGPWITGLSVASLLAGFGATLGKMLSGSDSPVLSEIEGWSKSVSRQGALTEYAQNNAWCWENSINLIGDVVGLLKEQRFIFEKIPYILSGTNIYSKESMAAKLASLEKKQQKLFETKVKDLSGVNIADTQLSILELRKRASLKALAELDSFMKGYQKIGEILSKGYMTAITIQDTYGEAKNAGASDLDATLLTLGYAAAEYALLNTGIGEWVFPELRAGRYKSEAIARALFNINLDTQALYRLFGSSLKNLPKEGKKQYVKKLFNIGRDIARAEYANGSKTLKATLASSLGEGIEEVSEEVLADVSKGCYDVVKWLQGEDTRLNSFGYNFDTKEFNLDDITTRYGMSLVGGFIGGGIANATNNYQSINSISNMTSLEAIQEMVYMARNGSLNRFLKLVNKMLLGDKNLSMEIEKNDDGTISFKLATENDNLDTYIKRALNLLAKLIEQILLANGALISDDSFLDKQTLGDLRFIALHNSSLAGELLNEFNGLSSDIAKLTSQINTIYNKALDSNGDSTVTDKEKRNNSLSNEDLALVKDLENQLKEKLQSLKDLLEGKKSYEFIANALFEMTPALSGKLATVTFPLFAELMYGKKFSKLTENEKAISYEKYSKWKNFEGRERIKEISTIFRNIAYQVSDTIKQSEADYINIDPSISKINLLLQSLYDNYERTEEDWLQETLNIVSTSADKINVGLARIFNSTADIDELNEIAARHEAIDRNLPEEEVKKLQKDIRLEYVGKLEEILLNNIDSYILPFIDRGFANVETKKQLSDLLKAASNILKLRATKWDLELEMNFDFSSIGQVNPFIELLSTINTFKLQINELDNTPLENNLNLFSISARNEPLSITDLLLRLDKILNDTSSDVTKFNIDDDLYTELENAISTILMYRAAILAARTDSARIGDLFGYNATLNEIAKKTGEDRKLAEINSLTADIFIADIDTNLKKLEFFKTLYNINRGLKLSRQERVSTKKDLLIYKRLRSIVQVPDNDELSKWEGFLLFLQAINGMVLHKELLNNNSTLLTDELQEEFLKETLQAEDAIYDFFLIESNKAKLNSIEELSRFISPTRLLLYTEAKELLNEGLDNLDDNSIVWWLASRIAVKSSDFYNLYKLVIDSTSEHPIAPISTQELAIYNNYASVVNGNVFSAFYKAMRYSLVLDWKSKSVSEREEIARRINISTDLLSDEMADYALNFLPVPRYLNITFTEGIPGSGKSTAVYYTTLKLLKLTDTDLLKNVYVVHGANSNSAETLRDNIGLDKSSKTFGREGFMKEINPEWKEYLLDPIKNKYLIPKDDYVITDEEKEIRSSLGIKETSTPPSLIIIDEISKFTAYDLDLIDKFAKKYGITVLVAGDFDLSGAVGSHSIEINGNTFTWNTSLGRTNFIRSPKLGVSMRTDNSLKTTNLLKLLAYMLNPTNENIDFLYFEDESGLYGDKVLSYRATIARNNDGDITLIDNSEKDLLVLTVLDEVDKLISTLKPNLKIGYIYSDRNSPIFALLSSSKYASYIDFKEGGSAQGLEGQYYIIEADFSDNTPTYLRDIYTGISRALLGSILIAPISEDKKAIKFNSLKVNLKIDEPLPGASIAKFADNKKRLLDKVVTSSNTILYTPREKESVTTTTSTVNTGGLGNGVASTPPTPTRDEVKLQLLAELNNAEDIAEADLFIYEASKLYPDLKDDPEVKALYDKIDTNNDEDLPPARTKEEAKLRLLEIVIKLFNSPNPWELDAETDSILDEFPDLKNDPDILRLAKEEEIFGEIPIISLPENLKEAANKAIQSVSTVGTYNDSDLDPDDSASHIKYGDIVQFKDNIYGVVIGIKSGDNGNYLYRYLKLDSPSGNAWGFTIETGSLLDITGRVEANNITPNLDTLSEPLIYEDNLNPITETDIMPENEYQAAIDTSNTDKDVPLSTADSTQERISISMLLHTFNTFETGVLIGQDGKPVPVGSLEWMDARIDSVNGLIKIDLALGKPVKTVEEYIRLIGRLRNILFNTELKSDICTELLKILGLSNIYCTFALKSTPRPGEGNRADNREFVSSKPYTNSNGVTTTMDKGISETTLFNGSSDTRSHEWHPKSIVAIIGSDKTGDILELPLIALSSPFTLLLIRDANNVPVFLQVSNRFEMLKQLGISYHDITLLLIEEFDGVTKYLSIVNLLKLFNYTDGGVFYINDLLWTPFRNLALLGPLFVIDRGIYLGVPGLNYDADAKPETEWITLNDFATNPSMHNPLSYVAKQVMVSITGMADAGNKTINIANAGHPFVLVSFDTSLNSDKKVVDYYIRLQADNSVPKKVKLVYVLPPKESIREYLSNLHKILNKESGVLNIGLLFTSYRLLLILLKNDTFREILDRKSPGLLSRVLLAIDELDALNPRDPNNETERRESISKLKDKLYETRDWSDLGFSSKPHALAGLFDGVLLSVAYNRNTLRSLIGLDNISEIDETSVLLMEAVLSQSNVDGVHYDVKIPKNNPTTIGPFVVPSQGSQYTINGKPFKIHGKLDSYMYLANMDWLVDYALSKMVESKGHIQSKDSFKYWDRKSNLNVTMTPELRAKTLIIKYLKSKTGRDFSSYYENADIKEANERVANELNSEFNDFVAFTIGNRIKISNSDERLRGLTTLYPEGFTSELINNANSSVIENHTVNNNGVYSFTLLIVQNNNGLFKEIYYDAEYDSRNDELILTPRIEEDNSVTNSSTPVTLSVTKENIDDYLDDGRELLESLFDFDPSLKSAFSVTSYEEFIKELDEMEYIGEMRIEDLESIRDSATKKLLLILDDLIQLEKSHDPDKQDDNSQTCPISFKIRF